jgi:hypothetical protein
VPVIGPEHTANVFGVCLLRALGRADHVAEQRRDDLPLFVEATPVDDERCAACPAITESLGIVVAAALARHVPRHVPMG